MSRVVGFVGVGKNCDVENLIFLLSKNIAAMGKKVVVFDFNFINESLPIIFKKDNAFDLKEYLIGKIGLDGIVCEIDSGLYFIKSNCFGFDYLSYKKEIQKIIKTLCFETNYVFINGNSFDYQSITFLKQIISEVCLVFDNDIWSIKNLAKFIKFFNFNNENMQINLVMNNSKIMGQLSKKYLSKTDIEMAIKKEIMFEFPKFLKHNFIYKKKTCQFADKLNLKFCKGFIANKVIDIDYSKKYKGFFGKFKRLLYEKYE